MNTKINRFIDWTPFIFTAALAAVTLIIYTLTASEIRSVVYLQVPSAALVPAVMPVASRIMKKRLPIVINILIAIHTILACNLGSAAGLYWRLESWDLFMHGYFGFLAGVTIYVLMLRWGGDKMSKFGFFLMIFLGVMGTASLWEVFEYSCDIILSGDAQRVQEAILQGVSPIKDTMTDIIVAIGGVAVFYVCLFIDKQFGYRLSKRIYEDSGQ